MQPIITEYPQYFTTTILQWKKLLKPEKYKDIIIISLKFLVTDKRVKLLDAKDKEYQFWKRNPLSAELRNHVVFRQKLNYIHNTW